MNHNDNMDETKQKCEKPSDFETAIAATSFGKFNLLLFIVAILTTLASGFESNSVAYTVPIAECDLALSLENKGTLNSMTYLGMLVSSFFWGIISDNHGRKTTCLVGTLLGSLCALISSFAQDFVVLAVMKFLGGSILLGSLASIHTYLCEFHAIKHRSKVPLTIGFLYGLANIALPTIGMGILPSTLKFSLFSGQFVLHSWNVFLFVCALPALLLVICFYFLPETPKYLMSKGREDLALKVFRNVYRINTGNSDYPISKLKMEDFEQQYDSGFLNSLRRSWSQIKLLFTVYIFKLVLTSLIMTFILTNNSTLRSWAPQIFQTINDYNQLAASNETNICYILKNIRRAPSSLEDCTVNLDNFSVYSNSMIIGSTMMIGYVFAVSLLNTLGKKTILLVTALSAGIGTMSLYFAYNNLIVLVLVSLSTMCTSVCIDVTISIAIDMFPTSIRGSALALILMCGRTGGFVGNMVFPYLVEAGCAFPFSISGGLAIACSMFCVLLPNTDSKALE